MLGNSIHDETFHQRMQMVTQCIHQTIGQTRKLSGQCYDTWLFPATHSLAITLMTAHMDF